MMENSTLRCQTYFLTMPYERRMIQFEVDRFSRACQKIWSHSAKTPKQNVFHSQHLESLSQPALGKLYQESHFPAKGQNLTTTNSHLPLLLNLCRRQSQAWIIWKHYVIWIEPRSSLSYHRTIEFGSMEQWRWHDGSMTMTQWYDSAMATVRWHDYADAIELWQWSDALSRHRHRTIVIASLHHRAIDFFALFLKKKWPQMWFFYSRNINFPCFLL